MKRLLIAGFIVVVLSALTFRLLRDLESYDKEIIKAPSREALEDPYLAFRRWAALNGVIIEDVFPDLESFPDSTNYDSIVFDTRRYHDSFKPIQAMRGWLSEGGSLYIIMDSHSEERNNQAILKSLNKYTDFGIVLLDREVWFQQEDMLLKGNGVNSGVITTDTSLRIQIDNLPDSAVYITDDEGLIHFVSFPFGEGSLTLSGSAEFLKNNNIGSPDNAALAWNTIVKENLQSDWYERPPKVLFMMGAGESKSTNRSPWIFPVIASWLTALALVIWVGLRRPDSPLAPLQASGSDIRRRLTAEGEFLNRHGGTAAYVNAARTAVKRRLRRQGWNNPLEEQSPQEIASRTGVEKPDLLLALGKESELSAGEYLRAMKILNQIEGKL